MVDRRIVFYTDADDRSPVLEFLRGLNAQQRRKVARSIRLLEEQGTALMEPHARYLQDGLWELRTQVGGDAYRCLYFTWTGLRFVILHVFQKKSKRGIKTPPEEVAKVKARLKEAEKHYAEWAEEKEREKNGHH